MKQDQMPTQHAELRTIAMPADTNAYGDIFGGWLLAQMDLAGGSYAIARARGRVATVGIQSMTFLKPVYVGDQVNCFCETARVGNTSITVRVQVFVRRRGAAERGEEQVEQVTEGLFTFVALNADGSKRQVPPEPAGSNGGENR